MPTGAGFAPAGSFSAGYGVTDSATVPNNAVLPDARTGFSQTGRLIDSATKDYVYTTDGRVQGLGTVPQLVQLALSTQLGSSAVPSLGQTFTDITEKGGDFSQRMAAAVARALANLVRSKQVAIVSLNVQDYPSAPDAGVCTVTWKDLTTGIVTTTAIGP